MGNWYPLQGLSSIELAPETCGQLVSPPRALSMSWDMWATGIPPRGLSSMSWDMWATGIPSKGSPLCPGTCGQLVSPPRALLYVLGHVGNWYPLQGLSSMSWDMWATPRALLSKGTLGPSARAVSERVA